MHPAMLRKARHHQQRSIFQVGAHCFFRCLVTQIETPCCTKADRGNSWLSAIDCLVVAVPTDAVFTVAIQIDKHRVKRGTRERL